jgi:hypothetical protein
LRGAKTKRSGLGSSSSREVWGSERGGKLPEKKLQDLLQAILRDDLEVEPPYYITSVRTFDEAGVPSEDRGLVVTMTDGSEFQITIVRSQ